MSALDTTTAVAARPRTRTLRAPRVGGVVQGLLGLAAVVAIWEGYKALGPEDGVVMGADETRVMPRTTDLAMPHVWDMVQRILEPTTSLDGALPLWRTVAEAAFNSLRIAGLGWLVGTVVGLLLAVLMQRVQASPSGGCCPGSCSARRFR